MKPDSASFGDYLRLYRKQSELTQEELAEILPTATTTVSRWERGLQTPDASTIATISEKLDLSYLEEYSLLATAGNVLTTKMPRLQQIKAGLAPYIEDIENDIFPSIILDYHFVQWALSPPSVAISGTEVTKQIWLQSPLHFFPLFNSQISGNFSHQVVATQIMQVKLFFAMNTLRRHESWFTEYPQFIKGYLDDDDYLIFESLWKNTLNDVNNGTINIFSDTLGAIKGRPIVGRDQSVQWKQRLEVIADLPQFAIMRFLPVDRGSAGNWFKSKPTIDEPLIKLWDVYDDDALNKLLGTYL